MALQSRNTKRLVIAPAASDSSDPDIERLSQRIDIGESSYSSSCDEGLASTESDCALPGGVVDDAIRVRDKIIN